LLPILSCIVFEKARNYADFMRICQIYLRRMNLGHAQGRAMLDRMKNEIKTVTYKEFEQTKTA